jgi:murein DD-endopeptidase MepM/ murein hydrolase activator NlpD
MIFSKKCIVIVACAAALLSCREDALPPQDLKPVVIEEKVNDDANSIISGVVKRHETLSRIMTKHGFSDRSAYLVSDAISGIFDVRHLKAGHRYTIVHDTLNTLLEFALMPSLDVTYVVKIDSSGSCSADKQDATLVKKIECLHGTIETTLYDAVLAKGASPELLFAFSDIFQWDIDFFSDPRMGDQFRLVYEALHLPADASSCGYDSTELLRYGRILAAQYRDMTALYFEESTGENGYYAPDGTSFQKRFLRSPLNYRRISSYFSKARRHPILKIVRPHNGIDFAAPTGTPVSATGDGKIIEKGYTRSLGRYVRIKHNGTPFETLYGHLSRFARGIQKGAKVEQRQVIGYVGMTGLATGPHLHYAVYQYGRPIDPLKIRNTTGEPIDEVHRGDFERIKRKLLSLLYNMDVQMSAN